MRNIIFLYFMLLIITSCHLVNPRFELVDLGTLGGEESIAHALNDSNWCVGQSLNPNGDWHAFLWKGGLILDLGGDPESFAYDINNKGYVVGFVGSYAVDHNIATLWRNDSLISLKGIGQGATIYCINESGLMGGSSWTSNFRDLSLDPRCHAVLWTDTNVIDLSEIISNGSVKCINKEGVCAGQYDPENDPDSENLILSRPLLWIDSKMTELPTLGNGAAEALKINDKRVAVGYSSDNNGETKAVIWKSGKMKILGSLGGTVTVARSINNRQMIVGESTINPDTFETHGFICFGKRILDLNNCLINKTGWIVVKANDINSNGAIAGSALSSDGMEHAILLIRK